MWRAALLAHSLLYAFAMTLSSVATADTDADAAEALFRDGRKAADEGHFEIACAKFVASQKLQPASGTLLNLADCEETRGQLTLAWHHFLALADSLAETDERKAVAIERARRLERTMPKLRIRLASNSHGARVWRDDIELGEASIGVALPVDPGPHVVVVSESGFDDHRYDLNVARTDEKDVEVSHGSRTSSVKPLALVLGGLGLGALGAGATTGAFALSDLSSSNARCAGNVCQNQAAVDKYRQAQNFALASDISLGVGAALLVTSVILLLLPHQHHATSSVATLLLGGVF